MGSFANILTNCVGSICLAAGCVLTPALAHAQSTPPPPPQRPRPNPNATISPGSRLPPAQGKSTRDLQARAYFDHSAGMQQAYDRALSAASCAVRGNNAKKILQAEPGSDEEQQLIERFYSHNLRCSGMYAGPSIAMHRAAIAERFAAEASESTLKKVASQTRLVPPVQSESGATDQDVMSAAASLAGCQAVESPMKVQAVLKTTPGSVDEKEAVDKVFESSAACGVVERPAEYTPVVYRGILASALSSAILASNKK